MGASRWRVVSFFEWQLESNETLPACEGLYGSIPGLVPFRSRSRLSEALVAQHCRVLFGCRDMYPGNPADAGGVAEIEISPSHDGVILSLRRIWRGTDMHFRKLGGAREILQD
jgi:hypothetical protein